MARRGRARHGRARHGRAWLGKAGRGMARLGWAWQGVARQGRAWLGEAWLGAARQGNLKTREGENVSYDLRWLEIEQELDAYEALRDSQALALAATNYKILELQNKLVALSKEKLKTEATVK